MVCGALEHRTPNERTTANTIRTKLKNVSESPTTSAHILISQRQAALCGIFRTHSGSFSLSLDTGFAVCVLCDVAFILAPSFAFVRLSNVLCAHLCIVRAHSS